MRLPKPSPGKEVLVHAISPPWGHMDALGHINNTRYFGYFEQARIAWLEKTGHLSDISGTSHFGPVILTASCTYIKQMIYPCPIRVHLFVGDLGRSSFMTWYELRGADETLYATGSAKMVWVDYQAEKSIALPEGIKTAIIREG